MSHIGKEAINIPTSVKVVLNTKENLITISGPHGELSKKISPYINIEIKNNFLSLNINDNTMLKYSQSNINSIWGLTRTLIYNMIKGVTQGHTLRLQLVGIGFKAKLEQNNLLILKLGFSHNLYYNLPKTISISVIKPTLINLWGIDIEQITQIGANIRSLKKPEPFNGKGIKYSNEIIKLKEKK